MSVPIGRKRGKACQSLNRMYKQVLCKNPQHVYSTMYCREDNISAHWPADTVSDPKGGPSRQARDRAGLDEGSNPSTPIIQVSPPHCGAEMMEKSCGSDEMGEAVMGGPQALHSHTHELCTIQISDDACEEAEASNDR